MTWSHQLNQPAAKTFSLGCSLDDVSTWQNLDVTIQLEPTSKTPMRIVAETIDGNPDGKRDGNYPLYQVEKVAASFSHDMQIGYNNFARGKKPHTTASDQKAIFTQLTTPARFDNERAQKTIPKVSQAFVDALSDILFLDPNPSAMRDYSFQNDTTLRGDGSNVSSVLYALQQDDTMRAMLLNFVRSLPEHDIIDFDFIETPRNEVMVQLVESFGGTQQHRDVSLLSDGTLRVLVVAAALLSAPEGSLVIIEEIDNGVHPSRSKMLLENMQHVAKKRHLRVLLTSHNPALLDNLPQDAVPDVVCCYRDPDTGASKLTRFADIQDYPSLIAQGSIGKLMAGDVLERFLKYPKTLETKQQEAAAFFALLESE